MDNLPPPPAPSQPDNDRSMTPGRLRFPAVGLGASTGGFPASTEELKASNEALRTTIEELDASKEELQSVNEELVTVNYELKMKVEEESKFNDDLNNFIASTDIATIFVDTGMRIKRYTPAATQLFKIIPADVGRSLLDIAHGLDYDHLADDATATLESLLPVERELKSHDGRFFMLRILPCRTTDDRPGGAVLTFVDITSRLRAEERARAGERRIQLFAESTKDYAIITSDADGVITSWSKGAERIFGYTEDEALGQNLDMLSLSEDVAAGVPGAERSRAQEEGRVEEERWYVRKNDTRLFCSGMLTPLQTDEFFGYAKIMRVVTERVQTEHRRDAEMAKEKAGREDAQAENVLKDQFLAVMSHELKQPLNLMHINAEMLMRMPEVRNSAAAAKAAGVIQKTIFSQAKIIDDLLDLSRLSSGKLTLSMSEMDFSAVTNSICEVARTEAAAEAVSITINGTETPIIIRADAARVEQVIWNLVNNAIKFTPAGGSIRVHAVREETAVRLDIADTGRGIAPESLLHVFDIYRQAASPTTRVKGGVGIGLFLVKQLVCLHGGHVEAASDGLEKGTRFSIWLPLP
jgi:two-component system CheB/CheR fusion protein